MPSIHVDSLLNRLFSDLKSGTLFSLFLVFLLGVLTGASPAYGQAKRAGETGYLKFG